ncbi:hypothetical protein [Kitasatospora purpeofusca]|uniref:hypothetical protein n=1 Tax=Kitasatospora purpeofusca TaxID=67352 RepID=UPI0037F1D160
MTPAARLTDLLTDLFGRPLPFRLKAWDGSTAGPTGAPTVVLRRRRALRRLLRQPGELGLADAFISGDLAAAGARRSTPDRAWRVTRTVRTG